MVVAEKQSHRFATTLANTRADRIATRADRIAALKTVPAAPISSFHVSTVSVRFYGEQVSLRPSSLALRAGEIFPNRHFVGHRDLKRLAKNRCKRT
jgi:hypothetical protein